MYLLLIPRLTDLSEERLRVRIEKVLLERSTCETRNQGCANGLRVVGDRREGLIGMY